MPVQYVCDIFETLFKTKVPKALAAGDFQPKPYHNKLSRLTAI